LLFDRLHQEHPALRLPPTTPRFAWINDAPRCHAATAALSIKDPENATRRTSGALRCLPEP
jgi:hypothetical protein